MIPLFKTWFSVGKSLLNCSDKLDNKDGGPDNLIQIALDNKLDEICVVEDGLLGFLQVYNACRAHKIKMRFGYRVNFCHDLNNPSKTEIHKNVIFLKKSCGYSNLVKLSSIAGRNVFEGEHTLDYNILHKHLDGLELVVPFYDSFIHRNCFSFSECVPSFRDLRPKFIVERNELPTDRLLEVRIRKQIEPERIFLGKSIYYKERKNINAFLTRKLMENKQGGKRKTIEMPGLDGFGSAEFCWESYQDYIHDNC